MQYTDTILLKVRDGTLVALKFFRPGKTYEGAVQRERYILDTFVQVDLFTELASSSHNDFVAYETDFGFLFIGGLIDFTFNLKCYIFILD